MAIKKQVKKKHAAAAQPGRENAQPQAGAHRSLHVVPDNISEESERRVDEIRRKQRRLKQKKRRRRRILLMIFVTLLLCAGIYCLLFVSPIFNVQSAKFDGYDHVAAAEIEAAAAIPIGENTFKLRMAEIEARVEALPYIKEAKAKRVWPDGISVAVTERQAYAYVAFAGSWYLVDEEGVALEQFDAQSADHIVLKGLSIHGITVGEALIWEEGGEEGFADAQEIIAAAEKAEIVQYIAALELSDPSRITFVYDGKYTVEFGTHNDAELKMLYLKNVVADAGVQASPSGTIRFDIDAGKAFWSADK